MRCNNFLPTPLSRREMLSQAACGFGSLAFAALGAEQLRADETRLDPFAPRETHFAPKAKSVIFLYMDGGPAHMDTFDPKPQLDKEHGQPFKMKVQPTQFDNIGNVLKSHWKFQQHGESGIPVSELFPHLANCVDSLCMIHSLPSAFSEHTNANYFLHTGHGLQGRPSMGAWAAYGLGSECRDLPGFIVLNGGLIPPGGLDCFHSGFLPASYQGSVFKSGNAPVADISPLEKTSEAQRRKFEFMRQLDRLGWAGRGEHAEIEAAIANYELAAQMQLAVPEIMHIDQESKATQEMYGLFDEFPQTRIYAQQCLVARRLVERGVRFIELTCPNPEADRWDQHSGLKVGHERNAKAVDQPIAALLTDLASRGLLDETLVVFSGEFGRTPMAQGTDGRDHNPFGFTVWMAGGGVKPGFRFGATDEYGYYAIENKQEMHDLHATILHLMGIDHTQLTYRFSSRDMRLTDVHGHVMHEIVA
ncbi:MAG: DUF1501 domain-containing protein [Planctomycetota bacterium]|nr:DUF1501 domain-containing protein [Planctomycetota bacterium]